jgi:antitoxin ParD1/3/4
MGKITSISIGQHFDQFIKDSVSEGRYQNASEVVRAGLRLLEEKETKIIALRKAISEGLESGVAHDFEPEAFLDQMKSKTHK